MEESREGRASTKLNMACRMSQTPRGGGGRVGEEEKREEERGQSESQENQDSKESLG